MYYSRGTEEGPGNAWMKIAGKLHIKIAILREIKILSDVIIVGFTHTEKKKVFPKKKV